MDEDGPMTCERLVDALDDYLDGHASAGRHDAVERHLAECASCAALAADVRALRAAARTLAPIEPPAHVWHAVRARVGEDTTARRPLLERLGFPSAGWRSVLQPLGAAAALVLVLSGLAWTGGR